ncbi:MAG TPA: hypothetical protein VGS12_18930 [Caulobacteraceae bacterium]|nr:hypothetical protein [Caulobacteraceae bacterium]
MTAADCYKAALAAEANAIRAASPGVRADFLEIAAAWRGLARSAAGAPARRPDEGRSFARPDGEARDA